MNFVQDLNPIQGSLVAESQDFWSINRQQFAELLTFVDFAANEKLTIGFIRIDFERDLDILMEGLKTHRRCQDIQFEIFNLDDKNLWSVREELMKGLKVIERDREKKLVLIVRGLASSIGLSGEYPLVLQTLNLNRDAFEITVPHPIIFCLPDYAIDRLSRYAPDFWVWKSGVFDFEATQKTQDTAIASSLLSDGFLERPERQQKQERIEFLHSRLVKYSPSNSNRTNGDLNSRISLLNELGVAYRSQGKFNDAREYLSEALELANTQEEPRNRDLALKAGVLRNLGTIDVANKDFDSALAYYQQALEIEEEIGNFLGKADTLERMTNLYTSKLGLNGTLPASEGRDLERLLVEVWTLKKRLLGPSHPDLAISRNNLALLYQYQRRYADAEPLYLEALALRKELLGSLGPDFAKITNNLAGLYYFQGRYEEAEPLYLEALAQRKELLGEKHPDVATSMNDLATLYKSRGRYSEAEPLYLEALALRKELLGEKHPQVAAIANNLAGLYYFQGRYTEAEALYLEALALTKELLGEKHPEVATSTNNLAQLYHSQGRYSEAEPLLREALALRKELLGSSHPQVATSTNNLALLYQSQERYGEAEPLCLEALAMYKELLGPSHPQVAASTNNLAGLYYFQGRYEEAELLYLEALALAKELLGPSHPQVATSTNNLAGLYYSQGGYEEAEPLYLEALALRKELLGEKHPDVATSTNNLALLYHSQKRYEEAEPLYLQALAIYQELLGDSHPQVATSTNNLALLLALTDRPTEALALMKEATEVEDRLIRRTFATSSDRDRLAYLEKIRPNFEILLSLVRNYLWDSPAAVATALDVVLKRKSLTASALAAFNHALNSDRYPHLTEDFQRWQQLNQEIVELTFSPPEANWPTTGEQFRQQKQDRQQRLNQLQAESDELQRRLASQISEIQVPEQDSDIRAIALELPAGSALLEFVGYRNYDFANNSWQPSRYLAFVLPAGQPEGVRAVDLGDAEEIDRSIARFRQATREPTSSSEVELAQGIFSEELQEAIEGYRHLLSFWGAWNCQGDTRSLEL